MSSTLVSHDHLVKQLTRLAAIRQVIDETRKDEQAVHAECIKLMQAAGLKALNLTPEHRALLSRPTSTIITFEAFRDACLARDIAPAVFTDAVKHTVDAKRAKAALGQEAFELIATNRQGSPRIRIVGARGKK